MKKRKQRVAVVYHGYCADGYSAALLSKIALLGAGCEVSLFPAKHGTPPHPAVVKHDGIVVVDFCYPADVMQNLMEAVGEEHFLCLDHHFSAAKVIEGKPWAVFDTGRAGVQLAWDHFFEDRPYPKVVEWIADRDLWKWEFKESRAFNRTLSQEPWVEQRWLAILNAPDSELKEMVRRGQILDDYIMGISASLAKKASPLMLHGTEGWSVEAPGMFASDVGSLVNQERGGFAAIWQVASAGQVLDVHLRSASDDFNVAFMAEQFGGGGHKRAAGFRIATAALPNLLSGSL